MQAKDISTEDHIRETFNPHGANLVQEEITINKITAKDGNKIQMKGALEITMSDNSLWGDESDGAVNSMTDVDTNAETIKTSAALTTTHNRIFRATSNVNINHAITVSAQDGQSRGSYPTTHGGPGVELGAILATIGSKGIPSLMRPGGDSKKVAGGVLQILAKGNITISARLNASGNYSALEGGGGGGLIIFVSDTDISGTADIGVRGSDGGNTTANAHGGSGGYSGEPGGHAGLGGSGGGSGAVQAISSAAGSGFIARNKGGSANAGAGEGGGGGGSLDNAGSNNIASSSVGADGGDGDAILANYDTVPTIFGLNLKRPTAGNSSNGVAGGNGVGGASGTNGGGGGGGGGGNVVADGGSGGNANNTNPVGSGGGGGGIVHSSSGDDGGHGGNASDGSPYLYVLSSNSVYAGLPGGQGGGGGGGGAGAWAGTAGTAGNGGQGAAGITPFVAGMGAGSGGGGADGSDGTAGSGSGTGGAGGAGGAGGNGGGAAGLVIMIAPTISYSGTVEGKLIKIEGAEAHKFIRGYYTD